MRELTETTIDGNAFHHLIFQWSVGIIIVCGRDLIHDIHTLDHIPKRCIRVIEMRACLVR